MLVNAREFQDERPEKMISNKLRMFGDTRSSNDISLSYNDGPETNRVQPKRRTSARRRQRNRVNEPYFGSKKQIMFLSLLRTDVISH